MCYKFKLGNKVAEATKNIYFEKGDSALDLNSHQMVKEISLGLQEPWWSGKVR